VAFLAALAVRTERRPAARHANEQVVSAPIALVERLAPLFLLILPDLVQARLLTRRPLGLVVASAWACDVGADAIEWGSCPSC